MTTIHPAHPAADDGALAPAGAAIWRDATRPVAERVAALMDEMTLPEKLAQLGSFWARPTEAVAGDVAPMEDALTTDEWDYEATSRDGLGHLTRIFGAEPVSVPDGVAKLAEFQSRLIDRTRLGIPAIAHEECLTGLTALGATVYPAAIAWGATFHPELIEEMAAAIGSDMAALGVQQGLSPLLDVVRDYRWGRVEETCGEDPYLVGTLGTAYVKGLQREGIDATLKHFAAYGASRAARNHAPVSMGRRELADVILPPFEMAVREGKAASVMNCYNDIDGEPCGSSHWLLTDVLRGEWGFEGTVVSDYWSVTFLQTMHKIAPTLAGAGAAALAAGLDVELPETAAYRLLAPLVESGELDIAVVDTAVERVLRRKCELGLLDAGWRPPSADPATIDLDSARNRDIARRIAEESIVLLKNDGVLPVAAAPGRVALIGPCSDEARTMFGCYSFPNHVLSRYGGGGMGIEAASLREALAETWPGAITYAEGCPIEEEDRSGIAGAVAAAKDADLVVLAVGDLAGLFGRGTSGEGCDAVDLSLPGVQADLVDAVLDAGTPVVLVLITGRPYSIGAFAPRAAAIVQAFMPGEEGAGAIARVLTGEVNPSGRLPIGIPNHPGGQPGTYLAGPLGRYSEGISNLDPRPLYPFGFGIGYTTFGYSGLELDREQIGADGEVAVSCTVTNTGARSGTEVVQLYLSDEYASVVRPVRELVGFARVTLEPGASARVTFRLHAERTSFTGVDLRRIVEPGWFTLAVGPSSEALPLQARFEISGQTRDLTGAARALTTPVSITVQ